MKLKKEFASALESIVGYELWATVAGEGTGSVLSLEIGQRTRRLHPLRNAHLSKELRNYESEFSILIECGWRLDSQSEVLCGGWDENDEDGIKLRSLQKIEHQKIVSVDLSYPGLDLDILFSNELRLRVFCDNVNMVDMADNYSLVCPSQTFVVRTRSLLSREEKSAESSNQRQLDLT